MLSRLAPAPARRALARYRLDRWRTSLPAALRAMLPLPPGLAAQIATFNDTMNLLPGGWCPENKQHLLAALILARPCRLVVEIGVFQGGSLLPMSAAARRVGGRVIGIDPYTAGSAAQKENLEKFVPVVGADWHARVDWEALHARVVGALGQHGLGEVTRILRATADDAAAEVPDGIELLHVDGNHDREAVASDLAHYVPKVASRGLIVLDDTHWDGVHEHYERLKPRCDVIYEASRIDGRPQWAVLAAR